MSSLTKYKAIYEGFKNYAFKTEEMEELAKKRAKICASCPHANPNHPFKLLLDDQSTKEINGMGCDLCHCLLSAKVRQLLQSCPDKRWK